ncbi:hypothetical protein ABTL78_19470, partial [Acinetobacter baumannii]
MRKWALFAIGLASLAGAQGKPVSAKAAYAVMARHEQALAKVVKSVTPITPKAEAGPISRTAFI